MTRKDVRAAWVDLACWYHRRDVRLVGCRNGVAVYRRPRWGHPGPATLLPAVVEEADVSLRRVQLAANVAMKEPVRRETGTPVKVPLHDDQAAKRWPLLWEQLTCDKYESGRERKTSSLLIFNDEGVLKGMLRERNTEECLWLSARGFIPLLDVFEVELGSEAPDWRVDKKPGDSRKGRGGK